MANLATFHRGQGSVLRARLVLPLSQRPIKDGAVWISENRIVEVGHWKDLRDRAEPSHDLGDVVLMPGLVNAHCHLDYTTMAGLFAPPKRFTDWIKQLTTAKAEWSYSDFAESWLAGAKMLLRNGTTTVGDIETMPELLPEVWEATPLRIFSFLEMTGVKRRRDPRAIIQETVARVSELSSSRCLAGLSPHAPYSTLPELLQLSAATARKRRWRLCTHVAESMQEFEMFVHGHGEMFDWLRRSGRDMSDCGLGSPVQHLARHGLLGEHLLAVHANYLAETDAALLAQYEVSVVHCPRSHEYFGHDRFPLGELTTAGVNVCLGTDSLASVCKRRRQSMELNLFEEMRVFAREHAKIAPRVILRMATQNAARALGMTGRTGELSRGAFADVIAVPFTGKASHVYAAVVAHEGPVSASMIDGEWALLPHGLQAKPGGRLQHA